MKDLIEQIAEIIYHHSDGMDDIEYQILNHIERRAWQTDAPWDSNSALELCEHERDDYRMQAKAVVEFLQSIGISLRRIGN